MTTLAIKRFKQRIDHGDVIESPRGEFVLYADFEELQIAAACVANAIAVGAGGCISGTLMEADLRKALRLAPGVLVDISK